MREQGPLTSDTEEIEGIGRVVAGLKGRAMQQVRRFLAMLARMRKDLSPSARIELIKELGWHLGQVPGRGSGGAGGSGRGPEPTWLLEGTRRIMNKLDDWQRTYEDHEERFRAVREEMATLDDGLACAEEGLAAKRAAELKERAKEIKQRLPVIAVRLGILWNEVTGSGRPIPSEIQLTSTGTEMTTEEHVVTADTHLRYAEGHLQPSEEHFTNAEVHLELVKAHLAALDVAEPAETGPLGAAAPPLPEPSGGETVAERAEVAPVERERSPAIRPRAGPVQRGRKAAGRDEGTPPPGAGEEWTYPVSECQYSAAHPLDECEGFKGLSVTKRREALKEWDRCECCLTDCRDRETGAMCYRRIGFRRHHLLRLAAQSEATPARGCGQRKQQSQGETGGAGRAPRGAPHGRPSETNGGRGCGRGQGTQPQKPIATWCFPAIGRNRELIWLRATRSQHVGVTRITHQATIRLGLPQNVIEAYQVRLKLSGEPRFVLRAEGVETLECVRPRNKRNNSRVLQPDVIIGWADWNKVQPFALSGWAIPGQAIPGATAPATKWHLRMNLRGGSPVYLNVRLDPMGKRSAVTHEAAVRAGETFHSFYMLFVRTEAGEVGSLVVAGADAVVRTVQTVAADLRQGEHIPKMQNDIGHKSKLRMLRQRGGKEAGGGAGCHAVP
jgi:hypothetical protein